MTYRTKTYIAGDWTGDKEAIDKLYQWKNSDYWSLTFVDAHDLTQGRDSSLNCSIKQSLKQRLDVSKTFVLIVGLQTNSLTAGSYNSWTSSCARGHSVDYRSYIKYECDKAVEAGMKIVVLYNSTYVYKSRCPEVLRNIGTHVPMKYQKSDGSIVWDYIAVKDALGE